MKKALLIGINYIQNPDITLRGCIDDIENMHNVLVSAYGYEPANIIMLRDDYPSKMPTHKNILGYLKMLASQSGGLDELWIHYSGHGAQIQGPMPDGNTRVDEVIVPSDYETTGVIIDDELYTAIERVKCQTVILMDSCHSGSLFELPWSYTFDNPSRFVRTHNINGNCKALSNPRIYMFSGCKDSQTSADTYSDVLQEPVGAFSDAFLTCLKRRNYVVPILSLYRDICLHLSEKGYEQIPVFSSSVMNPTYIFGNYVPKKPPSKLVLSMLPNKKPIVNKLKMIL